MITPEDTANAANLLGMTKAQLLNYAADNGIGGVSAAMRKAEILAVLEG